MEEKLPISLCMIVRDEELFLPDCLAAAAPYCSEIIVADTGSTDRTADIAEAFGAKVLRIAWQDDFALARNAAIQQASQPWILVLDADERLLPLPMEDWRRLLLSDEQCYGYLIEIRSRVEGMGGEEEVSDAVCRLFRNDPRIRFSGAIHEEAATAVSACGEEALRFAPVEVLHEGYRQAVMARRGKKERNKRILLAALNREPENPVLRYAMGTEYFTYGDWERAAEWLEPMVNGEEAAEDAGYLSDIWLKLVHALRALGRLEEAERYARSGLTRYGDFPDLHEAYAAVLMEMDRPGEAGLVLERACLAGIPSARYSSVAGSGSYRTMLAAGYAAERSYNWDRAAEAYAAALEANPGYRPAWERLVVLGTLDSEYRRHWMAAADRAAATGDHRLCRFMLELLADAGLQLEPEASGRLIEGLAVGEAFWSGLLAAQLGDPSAARQRWAQLPDAYPGKGEYLAALAWVDGGRAEPPPAGLAHALLRVRAWPAWLRLCPAAPAPMAAPVPAAPLQWCALLGAAPPVPALAAAQRLRAAAQQGAPARLAAGALHFAAGDMPAAAAQFAAAREAAVQPWVSRAAAAGLAAALAVRARGNAQVPALAAPLLCERELMLRVTSVLYSL
ncbi:hypothetical protein PghCCS26_05530 [Paenibacillus glycanilyticus]|uniref:Glycosyltransferase 2-like domain-containing protein n=1 Tax=Paenibacillus glycanilyticus TaxID=126569 RepID=A0ABQ6NEC2_9BACL|nr:glycosyltransferase [Paenibacillus glycanilyticus]GMK43426.1 hypothetical protein PghCCS26_05530 [Paenibacillus glycanilyticus]